MFKKTPKEKSLLDHAIDKVHTEMTAVSADSDDYAKMRKQLSKLYALKEAETSNNRVSRDTLALVLGNLTGIVLIVGHERAHVVGSKALALLHKLR